MLLMPECFTTERLEVRRIEHGDGPRIFAAYSADLEVARYMTFPLARSVADTEEYVRWAVGAWDAGIAYQWAILDQCGTLIGGCGIERVNRDNNYHLSFGYCLSRPTWGQGYATELARAFVQWFYRLPGTYRLSALVDVDNPASTRVLHKAGLMCEGVLRRYALHPNVSSEPRDVYVYAVVK